jgi:isoquinoline 1-oxidoreductase alpha subunit
MPTYTLCVNGIDRTVEAPPDMPLLWILRDLLHLTGTKYGCGVAQCRACTVHLDGQPTFSCILPVSAVGAAAVVTIEGLEAGIKEALLDAWATEDVPQCGYCQPGQVMSAAALLSRNGAPTDADIDEAMNGNLCRCGTYARIRKAIHRAAGPGG